MPIHPSQGSAWSLGAPLGVSAAAASACAASFALGSAAAWQRLETLTSSCSSCWLMRLAPVTSKLTQRNLGLDLILQGCQAGGKPYGRPWWPTQHLQRERIHCLQQWRGHLWALWVIWLVHQVYKTLVSPLPIQIFSDINLCQPV